MKKIILKLLCTLGFMGCSHQISKKDIFLFNTPEYNELMKSSNIKLQDTEKIICKAIKDGILLYADNKNITNEHFPLSKNMSLRHYLIYSDNYVFVYNIPTHAGTINISYGIFINRNTGELIQKSYSQKSKKIYIQVKEEYCLTCEKN